MRDSVTVLQRLQQQPAAFDFYAALRLIECSHPQLPRIGQAASPRDEALRLGQQASMAFAPAMLAALEREGDAAPRLLVEFFGLLGANGPMPLHLTEYVRDRQRNSGDATLARFLDLLQHRMISLLYRAWASAQPAVSLDRPDADRFGGYLGALIGIGMPSLRQRDTVPDSAKLHYAGRLGPQTRNADGLAAVLSDHFRLPVRVQPLCGHWMRLPADGLTRLRSGPEAATLGHTTVLGRQVWNTQHKFRLLLGPVDQARLQEFLPGAAGMRRLTDWVRQYAGLALDWDVQLIVKKDAVPRLKLGSGAQIGWNSWLISKTPERDDHQLRLAPRRRAAAADIT
ncbi:type VI secretion system protein ImpH [Duganella sp. 1224]|uniref:type VI secretion system baseplate subunit TssG n=1 Tax=Duganella sp. 1224 TaxID=2587052 RepID=UPI0015C9D152|nr:type VI secretion system baseplate subunit TssG [Duganella sp. 1224]NYE60066.1 type VI secretion system protein ImpH [Duganella sp. 1224]